MVVEALLTVKEAEKRPFYVFFLGILYTAVAIFLSLWIFHNEASLVMVFLIVFAAFPLVYSTTKFEAKKDYYTKSSKDLPKLHIQALKVFVFLFLGFTIALSVAYIILPADTVSNLFSTQTATIKAINNTPATGAVTAWNFFSIIVINNLKVLALCFLFSFFLGIGSLFILSWNASVIAAAMGNFFRTQLAEYAATTGLTKVAIYLQVFSLALTRYMTHGIFEILAYFIGGLAGGLISIAIINKHFTGDHFKFIMKDAVDLIIIALLLTVLGGLIEVYVTPLLFS